MRKDCRKLFHNAGSILRDVNLGTIDIILCWGWGDCPVRYRMLSSIRGIYPLDASSTLCPSCDSQNGPPSPG